MPISGTVQGMTVTVLLATTDPTTSHLFIHLTVTDPTSNILFYDHIAEYDRITAAGETPAQFVARVVTAEKSARDAAILAHLSKAPATAVDITSQAGALIAP